MLPPDTQIMHPDRGRWPRQAPEKTVQDHIRLLKEYNDIKDIGQQLIGLIAENREVPIGSLYADGRFGIGPED
jgi:hypothetical protein